MLVFPRFQKRDRYGGLSTGSPPHGRRPVRGGPGSSPHGRGPVRGSPGSGASGDCWEFDDGMGVSPEVFRNAFTNGSCAHTPYYVPGRTKMRIGKKHLSLPMNGLPAHRERSPA